MQEQLNKTPFDIEKEKCITFISEFTCDNQKKYLIQLQEIALSKSQSLTVDIADLIEVSSSAREGSGGLYDAVQASFESQDSSQSSLTSSIPTDTDLNVSVHSEEIENKYPHYFDVITNTKHYITLFHEAAKQLIPTLIPSHENTTDTSRTENSFNERQLRPLFLNEEKFKDFFKRFEIKFIVPKGVVPFSIRDLDSTYIGRLVRVRGIVSKASAPKPLAKELVYLCTACGHEAIQVVNSNTFTPLSNCPSQVCKSRSMAGMTVSQKAARLIIQPKASHFIESQKLKIQEETDSVIAGGIPKTMDVLLLGNYKNRVSPGDKVVVDGIWLPEMKSGFLALKTGLTSNSYLEGISMHTEESDTLNEYNPDTIDPKSLNELIQDFCSDIFGLEDVKLALLLLLVGGETRQFKDNVTVRGNINVLLVGDPGLAKSQLLHYTSIVSPRGITTTGRGSSGVGLTASVVRDKSGSVLEGGALVMADEGVCCIDEFDKMDENDRTGIHEVMEQQTVSIAKAGITATLNARSSILAASNPVFGRYDFKKDIESNVGIETALLSRFDLIFVLVDRVDSDRDGRLAGHILNKHIENDEEKPFKSPSKKKAKTTKTKRGRRRREENDENNERNKANESEREKIEKIRELQNYIKKAKTFNPLFPENLHSYIIKAYCDLRTQSDILRKKNFTATPRMLMSVLRLSQALARLRFSNEVNRSDVEEALRLLNESKDVDSTKEASVESGRELEEIKEIIVDMINNSDMDNIEIDFIVERLGEIGYTEETVKKTLKMYEQENVWMIDGSGKKVILV
eukprot:GAHX01001052.1.p1 GENE.GAHX01001052.1~~GAHX01001052.1.p1  ORF type:complete len:809 (-),score=197.28 GAHX01001052.1:34-2430(-)